MTEAAPGRGGAPLDVLHVIPGLGIGGAEHMLATLVAAPRARALAQHVVSLGAEGPNAAPIRAAGVPLAALGAEGPLGFARAVWRLARLVAALKPRAVQGWMYYGDLAALWALERSGRRADTRLYWGLRCSDMNLARYGTWLRRAVSLAARRSDRPDAVIANSVAGLEFHRRLGYAPRRSGIVFNGIDTGRYRPDAAARRRLRQALGIGEGERVVVHVARVDPMKDHASLVALAAARPALRFIAVGKGTEALAGPANLLRLGLRADVPDLLAAADLFLSTSAFGEGFSNAIAEAMAAGLPVVATDVGDARRIVGDAGRIAAPGDRAGLLAALDGLAALDEAARAAAGRRARARIAREFSVGRMVAAFDALHRDGIVPPCAASSA